MNKCKFAEEVSNYLVNTLEPESKVNLTINDDGSYTVKGTFKTIPKNLSQNMKEELEKLGLVSLLKPSFELRLYNKI